MTQHGSSQFMQELERLAVQAGIVENSPMDNSLETHIATRDGNKALYRPGEVGYALAGGQIPPDALYWQAGMAEWRPASELGIRAPNAPATPRPAEIHASPRGSHSTGRNSFWLEFIPFKSNSTEEGGVWAGVGRIGRRQFLARFVSLFIISMVALFIFGFVLALMKPESAQENIKSMTGLAGIIVGLLWILPTIKRLHDTGSSGWASLILFLPFFGLLLILLLLLVPGQKKGNIYGAALRLS